MLFLALKLETSGLPPPNIPKGDPQYPWFCQVGLVLFDETGRRHGFLSSMVRADGRKIQTGATAVHGIDNRAVGSGGLKEIAALAVVCGFAAQADYLVGYHVRFDRDVLESALIRLGKSTDMLVRRGLAVIDLVDPCSAFCRVTGEHESGTFRWPPLTTAAEKILGDPPAPDGSARDAFAGAETAMRLFLELRRRDAIEVAA
jgi:DNA polymerase III epsilon subunit-like protein